MSVRPRSEPRFSLVVICHQMRREAPRTLQTLQTAWARTGCPEPLEVIVIDSNSGQPLDADLVSSFGPGFRHINFSSAHPSPCAAMNAGLKLARGDYVGLMIDGARMVSPGVLDKSLRAFAAFPSSFVYTLSLHLGEQPQDLAVSAGYDQAREDDLLASVDWREDGYRLFDIAALANSSRHGYLGPIAESNLIAAPRAALVQLGGLDERFISRGGGFANLDLLNRLMQTTELTPVLLLGEGTFHQFHGGVATNVRPQDRPMAEFHAEYAQIRGEAYRTIARSPVFFGAMPPQAWRFLGARPEDQAE